MPIIAISATHIRIITWPLAPARTPSLFFLSVATCVTWRDASMLIIILRFTPTHRAPPVPSELIPSHQHHDHPDVPTRPPNCPHMTLPMKFAENRPSLL